MKLRFIILILVSITFVSAITLVSCQAKESDNLEDNSSTPEEEEEKEEEEEEFQPTLSADGVTDTYELIANAGYGNEAPDLYSVHTSEKHITQSYDSDLGRYVFNFHIHIDEDDDRGIATITDRQRNEIKTDAKSPDELLGFEGDKVVYHWYFQLPEGMLTTTSFTHIHQIKGIDNDSGTADVSNPVVTFTVRTKSSNQQFEIKYTAPEDEGGDSDELIIVDLDDFLGEWVEVIEYLDYSSTDGRYSATIKRCSDDKTLVEVIDVAITTWRTGAPAMRPKWGIYRNFGDDGCNKYLLRDETILFADFTIEKQ